MGLEASMKDDGTVLALGAAGLLAAGSQLSPHLGAQQRPPQLFWPAAALLLGGALWMQRPKRRGSAAVG